MLKEKKAKKDEEGQNREEELREKLRQEEEERRALEERNIKLTELERRYIHQLDELTQRQEHMRVRIEGLSYHVICSKDFCVARVCSQSRGRRATADS